MPIPKIIHYCWFGGGAMTPLAQRCVAGWSARLPGYHIQRWDESNAPIDEPCVAEHLRFRHFAFASDFVRAWVLEREGGIYLDVDMEVVRDFDALLEDEAFIGFQEEEPGGHWVNAAVVGSIPGHWFVREWLSRYRSAHLQRLKPFVIPELCTAILVEAGLSHYGEQRIKGVHLCPTSWFYPYHISQRFTPACIRPETVAIHHWNHDWGPGAHLRGWAKLRYRLARLGTLAGGLLRRGG